MTETQEIGAYKRKKKGGSRKCVPVRGYARNKPSRISDEKGANKYG